MFVPLHPLPRRHLCVGHRHVAAVIHHQVAGKVSTPEQHTLPPPSVEGQWIGVHALDSTWLSRDGSLNNPK